MREGDRDRNTLLPLTGWATIHCALCSRPSVNSDGIMQEVELARITSLPTRGSKPENTLFFSSTFSGTHSLK